MADKLFKMRPPDQPHVITATGADAEQPDWDATNDSSVGKWATVDDNSGPTDCYMNVTGEFPDGPDRWKQT